MQMKPVPINIVREIGKKGGARRVVVIAIDDDNFAITTWGRTMQECRALAKWAESEEAEEIAGNLFWLPAEETP